MNSITEQKDYLCKISVNTTPKKAFEKICSVSKWWTENTEGSSKNEGDVFTTRLGETYVTFEVTEIVPDKKAVWKVTDCYLHWLNDKKEWNNTELVWLVTTEKEATQVEMIHVGLTPDVECFNDCKKGWDHYIKDCLLKLIIEGTGLPEKKKSQS